VHVSVERRQVFWYSIVFLIGEDKKIFCFFFGGGEYAFHMGYACIVFFFLFESGFVKI
jgi:hypothetical protein